MARKKTSATPKPRRARKRGRLRSIAANLFSTLFAPILVGVILQAYQGGSSRAPEKPVESPVATAAKGSAPAPKSVNWQARAPQGDGKKHPILDALAKLF